MLDKMLIKPLMPIVKKVLATNQIDSCLQSFKDSYSDHIENETDSIVLVNSTENMPDGAKKEFLNICKMNENMELSLIEQFPLNEAISKLIEENI